MEQLDPTVATIPKTQHRLTPDARRAIQLAYLEGATTQVALARKFKVDRQTVRRCLQGDDFNKLKQQVWEEVKEEARDILRQNVKRAAKKWAGTTLDKAARKGNHKAMDDLLKATGVIEQTDQPRIIVQVGVKLTGSPEP